MASLNIASVTHASECRGGSRSIHVQTLFCSNSTNIFSRHYKVTVHVAEKDLTSHQFNPKVESMCQINRKTS